MQGDSSPIVEAMAINGKVTAQDLARELEHLGVTPKVGEPVKRITVKDGRANLIVEIQTEDSWIFLSFNDRSARKSVTVRFDATNAGALISMLALADEKQVDSKCYVDGEVQVSRV